MENIKKPFTIKQKSQIFLLVIAFFAFILGGIYVYLSSNSFRAEPKVDIKAENKWAKTIKVVADRDYAPYSYIDKNGEYQGLDVELMRELANRLNMNLDMELVDYPELMSKFNLGEADIIMNMDADSIVNNTDIIATLPIAEKQYVVYGKNEISSVADLYGRRVVSLHHMPGLGLDDEITYLSSYDDIFRSLKFGEYEYAICPIQVGSYFLNRLDIEDVYPSYAVMHVYSSLALHPKDTVLCVRLSAMLKQMRQEGRIQELENKWIAHRYENITLLEMIKNDPWLELSLIAFVVLFLLLFVSAIFQHRNAVNQATYNKQLQENLRTIEDQSERLKKGREELLKAKDEAERASHAKTTFLFNMSHDIRTPMNAIIGYIELAKRIGKTCDTCPKNSCSDDVPNKLREFIEKIEASSQHLLSLINDILEMSRIENGKFELVNAPMDFKKVMEDVRNMFATQMKNKGVEFAVNVDITHATVLCDQNRLDRVLLNLISNAYKFTPTGKSVSVNLKEESIDDTNAKYILTVKDTGIGMSREFAAKMWEAFERERTSTVSKIQGTGLGMAITKTIVDLMNGSIEVETESGQGTTFTVTLNLPVILPSEEESKITNADTSKTDFSGKRILLVDDIEVNREIAKMLLEDVGFVVDTAASGNEAVEKVQEGNFDAVLMDIQMPIMDGYEATHIIRNLSDPKAKNIPIIAMTANAFSEDKAQALAAGMNGHISKPIDIPKMIETLSEFI